MASPRFATANTASWSETKTHGSEPCEQADVGQESMTGSTSLKRSVVIEPSWPASRQFVARCVSHPLFDMIVSVAILIQFVLVILETNMRADEDGNTPTAYVVVGNLFLSIYIIELGLRIYAFRMEVARDVWGAFEIFLVLLDLFLEVVSLLAADEEFPSITALRVMKVMRVGRWLKVVREVQMFRELYMMMHGFLSAMRAIGWATLVLLFMLTAYAILAVEMLHPINKEVSADGTYDGCERCPRAFETVQASVVTFIQHIVAGDSWGSVSIPIMEKNPWASIIFLAVLVSVDLGLLNLILTVIVDRAAEARREDKRYVLQQREAEFAKAKRELKALCGALDLDNSGSLSKDELLLGFDNVPEFAEIMRLMEITREDITALFTILDEDGGGTVDYDEFAEQLHKMKSQDVQMMLVFIRRHCSDIRSEVHEQLEITKDVLSQRSLVQEMRSQEIIELIRGLDLTSLPPKENQDLSVVDTFDKAPDAQAGGKPPIGYPKLPQGRLVDALEKDLAQLRQQLSMDLAAAACRVVDSAVGQLLGPASAFGAPVGAFDAPNVRALPDGDRKANVDLGAGGTGEAMPSSMDASGTLPTTGLTQVCRQANQIAETSTSRQSNPGVDPRGLSRTSGNSSGRRETVLPRIALPSASSCCSTRREDVNQPQIITSSKW